jgi:hypothetical protein
MQTFRSCKRARSAAVSCFPSRIACGSWSHTLRRTRRSRGRRWRPGKEQGGAACQSSEPAVRPRRRRRGKKGASPGPGLGRGVRAAGGKGGSAPPSSPACLCSASRLAGSPDRGPPSPDRGPTSYRRAPLSDRVSRRGRGATASAFRSREPARMGSSRLRLRIEAVETVLLLPQAARKEEGARARCQTTLLLLAPQPGTASSAPALLLLADLWRHGRARAGRGHGAAARRGERRVAAMAECDRGRERGAVQQLVCGAPGDARRGRPTAFCSWRCSTCRSVNNSCLFFILKMQQLLHNLLDETVETLHAS